MSKPCNCGGVCVNGFGRCPTPSYPSVATMQADHAKRAKGAAVSDYERGLRRGMAIAREAEVDPGYRNSYMDWDAAEAAVEREIEEAKR